MRNGSSEKDFGASYWLLALVFFTSSWDLLLKLDIAGFTLKLYQPLALGALAALIWETRKADLRELLVPLTSPFTKCLLLLGIFYFALAPWSAFPLKSSLYAGWLFFDLFAIWLVFQHVATKHGLLPFLQWSRVTMLFLSSVIFVDYFAYQFGFRGGLLGWNQDIITNLGLSRPHAFSSEPSYVATFLCLALLTCGPMIFQRAKSKCLAALELSVVGFAIVATTSRTGWVSLGGGLGLLCLAPLLVGKKIQWKLVGSLFALVTVASLVFVLTTPPEQRAVMKNTFVGSILSGTDSSGNSRVKAHLLAFEIAKDTNFLGAGFAASYRYFKDRGGFDYSAQEEFNPKQYGNELIMSTWGQLLSEGGLPAVLLFLSAAIFLVKGLLQSWKQTQDSLALGSLVASCVFFFFAAFWLGNVCRADIWVWYAIWSAVAVRTSGVYSSPTSQ